MMKKTGIPLYLKIFAGMIAGILAGFVAIEFNGETFVVNWIAPWGQIFIRLLGLIAIPLVFTSLVKGIAGLKNIGQLSRLGGKTVGIYLVTTVIAVMLGVLMCSVAQPGRLLDKSSVADIQQKYQHAASELDAKKPDRSPLAFLTEIVPKNIVHASSDNSRMLQIIFFAILFSLAALSLPATTTRATLAFFDSLNEIILRMVEYIIRFTPLGVMALMAKLTVDVRGDAGIFGSLAMYSLTVFLSLLFILLILYPAITGIFTHIKAKEFIRAMYPVQLFAFTTSSSAATLPVNMDTVENKLKISKECASFVLPVGVTINMDGTSCYQSIAVLFIAQALGIELDWQQMFTIIGLTVVSSIGTPGIPGGSYVILAMVLSSAGIPAEGLALILGVDRPLDMMRTSVNVTGDAMVASIMNKQFKN
jgi:Na+/H+-dicarboxylate symporter